MERNELVLRAVVEKEGNGFSSICLDIDVASCGSTIEEALENLKEAVTLYLQYASENGKFETMVPRPVPKNIMKHYNKKLRDKSSERQEHLRREPLLTNNFPCRVVLQPQYAF
ncbi:hypothetical protein [Desulfitobacterium sp.]|uniref:type II toxin-antitoxin system HicB family antitoxin n=1 Tax=Desulfitobacterium sp. TaxID=49981 RepID=UPI002CF155EA|nr:hypothetical protein [Desulfitobacterium sp.]HVJ47916.1 hypothetical protein [Desulfitobacterium sp.]